MFEQFFGVFDFIMSPITIFNPVVSLLIISTLITVTVMLLNYFTINKKLVREIKNKMEELRESLTAAQKIGNTEEANKFLSEMMKANSDYMKQTFKALIVSLIVVSIFLPWLRYKFEGMTVAALPFTLPVVGSSLSWLFWYILVSFTMGWIIKKIFEVDYA